MTTRGRFYPPRSTAIVTQTQHPPAANAADETEAKPGGGLAGLFFTVTGNLYILIGTLVMSTLALLGAWAPFRRAWFFICARLWSRGLLLSAGARVETRFAAPLPADRPHIYMVNHQSLYDIPALILAVPAEARFLAKRGLFQIPIFGWVLRSAGFISIDRGDRSRASESFAEAIRSLQAGASAVVFPEGTRSTDGRLLPFQRGGFLLAIKAGLPIVPVGIHGSMRIRHKESLRIRPGRITISFGRPLETGDYGVRDKARLMEDVRRRVLALSSG